PPKGLTGLSWISTPDGVAVSFFDPDRVGHSVVGGSSGASNTTSDSPPVVGYVISNKQFGRLTGVGPNGLTHPTPVTRPVSVGGHDALLATVAADSPDLSGVSGPQGFPADQRVVWQLPDGQWIHVWVATAGSASTPTQLQTAAGQSSSA